jgi:hypothetical protein
VDWGDGVIETITYTDYRAGRLYHTYAVPGEYTVILAASSVDCRFRSFMCSGCDGDGINYIKNQISNLKLTGCSDLEFLLCTNNQITELDLSGCTNLKYLYCEGNQLAYLDLSGCLNLEVLFCSFNLLTHLDLSGHPDLRMLGCNSNQLTRLDLSDYAKLEWIICVNNQLQLSDLYAACLLTNNQSLIWFGAQNLLPQTVLLSEELFSEQSVFDGIFTNYSVTQNGNPAPEGNYNVNEGKLTFNSEGQYTVTMSNEAIVKYAQVVVEITVAKGTGMIKPEHAQSIRIYPNPTTGELGIRNYELGIKDAEIYDVMGKSVYKQLSTFNSQLSTQINVSHLPAGVYFVRITTETGVVTRKIIKM